MIYARHPAKIPALIPAVAISTLAFVLAIQPAAASGPPTNVSTTTTHHHASRGRSSGDALTAQLNHQELVRVSGASENTGETITNVTRYNYGHQTSPSGVYPTDQ